MIIQSTSHWQTTLTLCHVSPCMCQPGIFTYVYHYAGTHANYPQHSSWLKELSSLSESWGHCYVKLTGYTCPLNTNGLGTSPSIGWPGVNVKSLLFSSTSPVASWHPQTVSSGHNLNISLYSYTLMLSCYQSSRKWIDYHKESSLLHSNLCFYWAR